MLDAIRDDVLQPDVLSAALDRALDDPHFAADIEALGALEMRLQRLDGEREGLAVAIAKAAA